MNTKKIWISALIFGLIATGILYFSILSKNKQDPPPVEEIVEEEPIVEEERVVTENTLIPITEGKRAMSLQVSVVQGVSGFIKPGSLVDVVAVLNPSEEEFKYTAGQHDSAALLLQNIKVLAIGHSADLPEEAKRYETVTLEVTPREGLLLGFAIRDENQIYLTLRSEGDSSIETETTHIHEDELHKGVFKP
ncbi:Flp pilus assembly protein CpaB [Lysinibacillus antri]|uniref:Flp pilus assembly protein CpaB n=1 Tax=Lysinibacillus antri TaxID=2498145 RepID=UPI001319DBE7|nr:Flp pilus assembly protein CpaB [Lysinibacillus antri]